ncbi:threonine ammonia-lyase [uncultured Clostridium sp.]|uniref:threonine ammonia-lyase n=1 Tax=uncultured Clostridium sp. TaxID=59620 RepID=UPI0026367630|nr:threonine ammonia-lyase [uncultured Clostridium sp.]
MYLDKVKKVREKINDKIIKTPLMYSKSFSEICENQVYIKCENLQITGAYKLRGALNKISTLSVEDRKRGVICSSAGNHAQGVAYAASLYNIKSTIVMPKTTPLLKINSTKELGGNVVIHGDIYDDAYKKAKELEKEKNLKFIHPFNDIDVILGQATIALELIEDLKDIDIVLCPIGGGGLISGIALVLKEYNPNIKIIGVEAQGACSMKKSILNGMVTTLDSVRTIADGIAVKTPGDLTFTIVKDLVDEIITVSDKEIVEDFVLLSEKHKLIAEPSGVVSLSALKKLNNVKGKKIVSIISGGNIDMITMSSLIKTGLVSKGRLFAFSMELPHMPGELVKVTTILSKLNANIVELEHNQFKATDHLRNVSLEVTVETNGLDHISVIKRELAKNGYLIKQIY